MREKRFYENARLAQESKAHPGYFSHPLPAPPIITDYIYQDPRQLTSEMPRSLTTFSDMSSSDNNDYQIREAKIVFRQ